MRCRRNSNTLANLIGRHVVEQQCIGTCGQRFVNLFDRVAFNMHRARWPHRARTRNSIGNTEQRDVVVLQQNPIGKIAAVVTTTTGAHCGLFKNSKTRRGLACVPYVGSATLGRFCRVLAGERCDSGKVTEEIQRRAFSGKDRCEWTSRGSDQCARANAVAVINRPRERHRRIDLHERFVSTCSAGDDTCHASHEAGRRHKVLREER